MASAQDLVDRAMRLVREASDELAALAGPERSEDPGDDVLGEAVRLRVGRRGPRDRNAPITREDRERPFAIALLIAARDLRRGDEPDGVAADDAVDTAQAALSEGDLSAAAEIAASLLQAAADGSAQDWNHGNLLHHGHIILGIVRLREGDVPAAEAELRAAGQTPGSPQLNSFGPDLSLAWALLRLDRDEAVLDYLHGIARFWAPSWRYDLAGD